MNSVTHLVNSLPKNAKSRISITHPIGLLAKSTKIKNLVTQNLQSYRITVVALI
jgi:hypothetical protein